jgi:archaellum biogenesis ATPase FlaH
MENENQILKAALRYCDMGFSIIPIGENKRPLLAEWKPYQEVCATKEQVEKWFEQFPQANIGIITGKVSNIVVIDVDDKDADISGLIPTAIAQTGRGFHYYYSHPGFPVHCGILRTKIDIKGDGGYVIAPPSLHASGRHYEWVCHPDDVGFADLPQWVFGENGKQKINQVENNPQTENKVYEGQRNDKATRFAGKLLHALPREDWELGWSLIQKWNQKRCVPPLPESELRRTFDSISGRENKRQDGKGATEWEIKTMQLSELVKMDFPNPKWLVDRLIPHEAVTIISGTPASYKTFLTLDIALKVASGEKVFGNFQATQSPVLIIDEENNPRVLQERVKLLSQNLNLPIFIASKNGFQLNDDNVQKIVDYAKSKNVQLIIFDSFICIHQADENVASEMRNVMKHLKEIASHGIAVIVIHHHRKRGNAEKGNASQDMRGSSDILAQVDCHLAIDRKKSGDASVTIQQVKLREAKEMEPFVVCLHSNGESGYFEYVGQAKEKQDKQGDVKEVVIKILGATDKPLNKAEIWRLIKQSGIEVGQSTYKTAFKELVETGEILTQKGDKNTILCSLNKLGDGGG